MSKVLRFTFAPMILLAFCLADLYPHPSKPKHADIHGHPEKKRTYKGRTVYQHYTKSCPQCNGQILGVTYEEEYHKVKVRWERWQWDSRRRRWNEIRRTKWYKLPNEFEYPSQIHWGTTCSGGNPNCNYGHAYAYLNKPLIYFVGGYHV